MKQKITEELLATSLHEFFDVRTANLLERNGVHTLLDLLYCCGQMSSCNRCRVEECKATKKLIEFVGVHEGLIDNIYARLEELGIMKREAGPPSPEKGRPPEGGSS